MLTPPLIIVLAVTALAIAAGVFAMLRGRLPRLGLNGSRLTIRDRAEMVARLWVL